MMNFMESCTKTIVVYLYDTNIAAKIIYEIIFLISDWKFQPGNELILTVYKAIIKRLSSLRSPVKF